MALIDGVGDEVTAFLGLVFLALVLVLAWISTHTADPSDQLFAFHSFSFPSSSSSSNSTPAHPTEATPSTEGRVQGQSTGEGAPVTRDPGPEGKEERGSGGDELPRGRPVSGSASFPAAYEHPERHMVLRLKFLNDTERVAQVKPEDTIGYIKRKYFAGEEHLVRLIYQGQLLRDDTRTLDSLNLGDNCVVHCHISQGDGLRAPAGVRQADPAHGVLGVGTVMVPLFVLMLSVLWYFQVQYRQLFSAPATASLVGITVVFSFVAYGLYQE